MKATLPSPNMVAPPIPGKLPKNRSMDLITISRWPSKLSTVKPARPLSPRMITTDRSCAGCPSSRQPRSGPRRISDTTSSQNHNFARTYRLISLAPDRISSTVSSGRQKFPRQLHKSLNNSQGQGQANIKTHPWSLSRNFHRTT